MKPIILKGIHLLLLLGTIVTLPACQPRGGSDDGDNQGEKIEQDEKEKKDSEGKEDKDEDKKKNKSEKDDN